MNAKTDQAVANNMDLNDQEKHLLNRFNNARTIRERILIKRLAAKAGYLNLVDIMLTRLMPDYVQTN